MNKTNHPFIVAPFFLSSRSVHHAAAEAEAEEAPS